MRGVRLHTRIVVVAAVFVLAIAGGAWAFQELPPGGQVNSDPEAGINPALPVNGEEPTNADVVGGALVPGKPAVPWAIFRQSENTGTLREQIFVRSFAGGKWTTRGIGTVGGRSSNESAFPASLNFDQSTDGEVPAIDFAGSGRTVPWATWYENTSGSGFGSNNVFASFFDNKEGDSNKGKWIFAGQGRGNGGSGPPVPSLNIHTNQVAENPSVAGGSAVDPNQPGPWVTWQETSPLPLLTNQIFVERPVAPAGVEECDKVTPKGVAVGEHVPAIGGLCWQEAGVARVGPGTADPSLNVDPTREGIEPDIAFTGPNDSVPWVVWYEEGPTELEGPEEEFLHENDMVFAAKGVKDESATGGFHWEVVGTGTSGVLDRSGFNSFGKCAEAPELEGECSLNANRENEAVDPRVAAGTMNPTKATVPWVTWQEDTFKEGKFVEQIFVSRLVGSKFELANHGNPISGGALDAARPDITFSGNTPYVSWREEVEPKVFRGFYGHFVNAASPEFVLDESDVPLASQAEVREPISSGCIATPFNGDGSACQGGALGTPFFLFTNGSPLGLFADAYRPETPQTGSASSITTSSAVVSGSVNPSGAPVHAFFEFGTSTAYGQTTAVQTLGVGNAAIPIAAAVSGLPPGTTIHYRVVATTDFGTFPGPDQTLKTAAAPPPPVLPMSRAGALNAG